MLVNRLWSVRIVLLCSKTIGSEVLIPVLPSYMFLSFPLFPQFLLFFKRLGDIVIFFLLCKLWNNNEVSFPNLQKHCILCANHSVALTQSLPNTHTNTHKHTHMHSQLHIHSETHTLIRWLREPTGLLVLVVDVFFLPFFSRHTPCSVSLPSSACQAPLSLFPHRLNWQRASSPVHCSPIMPWWFPICSHADEMKTQRVSWN